MNWHRLFGVVLMDFFRGTPFEVEVEKDLSQKRQLLDVVVVRRRSGELNARLPDGMEALADHNLITFKSHHESLDDWVLKELTGHYVNYRKQVSPSFDELLPETDFRLFAVCARMAKTFAEQVKLKSVGPGVYDAQRGTDAIRVILTRELPEVEHNAMLQLFSAVPDRVRFAAAHYRLRSDETSTVLADLFKHYQLEGIDMPYTMEQFKKDALKDLAEWDELQQALAPEILKRMSLPQRLEGVSREELEAYLRRLSEQDQKENGDERETSG